MAFCLLPILNRLRAVNSTPVVFAAAVFAGLSLTAVNSAAQADTAVATASQLASGLSANNTTSSQSPALSVAPQGAPKVSAIAEPRARLSQTAPPEVLSTDKRFPTTSNLLPSASAVAGSLLDEVGHFQTTPATTEVAGWKQELKTTHPSAARGAWLHLWLGEWELAQNQQPEQATWHFRQAQRLTNPQNQCYGLAAYDQAIALFYSGAYADASDAFSTLLHPKTGFPGYDRRSCALWLRHAQICAGTHDAHAKLGIPEPSRLDPFCGAASLAACLQSLSLPYSRQAVLKACTVTGEGSTFPEVLDAARKLGLNARAVTADDQGLIALPKPLVAYVEQDHFVALVRADKVGISYLCSDCGPWPGGRVDLTWAQWHALSPGIYGSVTRPGSASDTLVQAAVSPLAKHRINGIRLSYTGSLSRLGLSSPRLNLHLAALALRGHVARYIAPIPVGCGSKPNSLHCSDWSEGAMYRPGGSGDGPQNCDPVNLATGEEEYAPAPDLVVYNSAGPTISWGRIYNSLRAPDTTSVNYSSADFGVGWSNTYSYRFVDPSPGSTAPRTASNPIKLILPNGAIVPITGTPPSSGFSNWNACTVPAGTPFRVDWGFGSNYYFVITMADRSRFIFYPAVTGQQSISLQVFLLNSIMDKNGNSIAFSYLYGVAGLLSGIANSGSGAAGINISRNSDNTINSVSTYNGGLSSQIVFYHVASFGNTNIPSAYPAADKSYAELDNVSSVAANTNQANPFSSVQPSTFVPASSRWTYGYTAVPDGDTAIPPGSTGSQSYASLSSITAPSPASAGGVVTAATAYINYGTNFVTSLVDANHNTTTLTAVDGTHTKVALTDGSNNLVYSYTVGFDPNMNLVTKTDGSNSTVLLTKTFNTTSADPYRPVSITNGNNNTWQFVWDQYGNLHQTKSPRGIYTNYTWAFSGTLPSVVNSVAQTGAPVLGELVSVQQGSKVATTYTYIDDTAHISQENPLSPDYTNSGLINTIKTALPGTPGTTNSTAYSLTYIGNTPGLSTVVRPGNSATGTITTAYGYGLDSGDGAHHVPSYTSDTFSGPNPFTPNDYEHPLTVTEELYPLNTANAFQNPVTHYRYDDQGHVYMMYDALGNETDFGGQQVNNTGGYNAAGQLLQIKYPTTGQTGSGHSYTNFTYLYVGGPLTSKQLYDESGNLARQTNYTYGPEGELLSVSGSTEPVIYTYDALYRMTALQDGNNHVTHYYYNAAGYLDSVTYPGYIGAAFPSISGPDSLHFTYDLSGNLATRTDGNGVVTTYDHTTNPDSLLNSISYSYPQGYTGSTAGSVALGYDTYGRLSSMADNNIDAVSYGYDDLDNPLSVQTTYTGLSAQVMSYGYNPDGSRKSLSFPQRTDTYTYDTIGRLTGLTDQYGESAAWQYDAMGRVQLQTDSNGLTAAMKYNPLGQLIDLKNTVSSAPLSEFGSQTQSSGILHDAAGNTLSVPSTVGNSSTVLSTTYAYDSRNQLTQETSARTGLTNTFGYDVAGNSTDMRGVASPGFNINNQTTTPAGINLAFNYDGNGNPGGGHGAALIFDPENRLTTAAAQTAATPTDIATGSDGNMRVLWNNADGSVTLTVVNIASGNVGSNLSYGPYPGWTAIAVAVGSNGATRILWNNSGGQISIWNMNDAQPQSTCLVYGPYAGWTALSIAIGPDNTVHILWNHAPDNMMSLGTINNSTGAYSGPSYGPYVGWAVKDLTVDASNTIHVLWNNVDGHVSLWNMADAQPSATCYVYGPFPGFSGQSLAAGPASDPRIHLQYASLSGQTALWTINSDGSYTYSPNFGPYAGWRPFQIASGSDNITRILWGNVNGTVNIWDVSSNNTYTIRPALTPTAVAGTGATFSYRGDGLRAWKQNSAGTRTFYLYDGKDAVCELNSSGQVNGASMFGANGLMNYSGSGHGTLYYAFDERSNVAQRVDASGNVASSDFYDAYGKQLSGGSDVYGFGGQSGYRTDPETGLIFLTHRYYDASSGRFLTRDPSGYGGGINLYSYVQNNPGNSWDPLGLCGGDDAEPGFWDAVSSGLNVGLKATGSALSFGLYDGGDAKCDPSFGTSKMLAGVGRDAAIMAATMGTGGEIVAEEEGAGAVESEAEGAEAEADGCPWARCFTSGTPVQMADGSTKPIEQVLPGDQVKSRDPQTGLSGVRTVTASIKRVAPAVVTVSLTDAKTGHVETLTCTPEHPFFTVGGGWVEAGSLGSGRASSAGRGLLCK